MASAITHGVVGLALAKVYTDAPMPPRYWILAAACAILPDADAAGFALGVRYGSLFGHRGFSHSLAFAALVGLAVVGLAFRAVPAFSRQWWGLWALFAIVTASHPVLDALTNGGMGVAFFSPFVKKRYFFPWRPIEVSPIGVKAFFSRWGVRVLASEIRYVWLPVLGLVLSAWLARKALSPPPR